MSQADDSFSYDLTKITNASYNLPTHKEEGQRLDYQHNLFRATFAGKRYFSPLKSPKAILDLGCGTGLWAVETSDEFSQAEIMGMDLGHISPPEHQPTNFRYVIANFEEDWPFQQPFDYIHGRMIVVAMRNHRKVIQQAYQHLSPGGWFELQDFELGSDGIVEDDPPSPAFRTTESIMTWSKYMAEGSAKLGVDLAAAQKWPTWLEEAGFTHISHKLFKWPIGPWPDDEHLSALGQSALDNVLKGLEGFSAIVFTKGLGWSRDELRTFLAKTREGMTTERHYYMKIHVFCAQKPADGELQDP